MKATFMYAAGDVRVETVADPIIQQPALVIYGDRDVVPRLENMADFVPNVEVVSLDSGHCIQQEQPEETTRVMLEWLGRQG